MPFKKQMLFCNFLNLVQQKMATELNTIQIVGDIESGETKKVKNVNIFRRFARRIRRKMPLIIFIILHIGVYFGFWAYSRYHPDYQLTLTDRLGEAYPIARGAAWVLNIDMA
jgi:hypothetical protein